MCPCRNISTSAGESILLLDSGASCVGEESCFVAGKHKDEPAVIGISVSVLTRRELANANSVGAILGRECWEM